MRDLSDTVVEIYIFAVVSGVVFVSGTDYEAEHLQHIISYERQTSDCIKLNSTREISL